HQRACDLLTARDHAFSVRPAPAGWLVSVEALSGKAKGSSTWLVEHGKAEPQNAAARLIAGGCASAGGPGAADLTGDWVSASDPSGPPWVLKVSGSTLNATWKGSGAHAALRGSFTGTLQAGG